MNISFYNGVSGMVAYQESMNRISHNIANTNTVGFKPSKSNFSDLLYTEMAVNAQPPVLTGHGVRIEDSQLLYRQGAAIQTGNTLDYALLGDGFFAVKHPNGSVEYTRNGAFDISIEGSKGFLVTADGSHVLDEKGKPIELERNSNNDLFDLSELQNKLGIYDVPNPHAMEPASGSCLRTTAISGEAKAVSLSSGKGNAGRQYQIIPGALEQSAVDLSDEMTNVIVTQKAFQFNAKMVQTADQLEEIINNLR